MAHVGRCIPCPGHELDLFILFYDRMPSTLPDDEAVKVLTHHARTEKDIAVHKGPVVDLSGNVEWAVTLDEW